MGMRLSRTENHSHLMSGYVGEAIREMAQLRGKGGESTHADYFNTARDYETRLLQLQPYKTTNDTKAIITLSLSLLVTVVNVFHSPEQY